MPRPQQGATSGSISAALARLGTIAALAALTACGGSGGSHASATTQSSATSTTADPELAAVATAYRNAELAVAEAATIPNPDDPRLQELLLDPFAKQTRDVLRGYQLRKLAIRYPGALQDSLKIDVDVQSIDITGETAVLEACAVDRGQRVPVTQPTVGDGQPTAVLIKAGMRRDSGRWKLAERETLQSWQGASECAH